MPHKGMVGMNVYVNKQATLSIKKWLIVPITVEIQDPVRLVKAITRQNIENIPPSHNATRMRHYGRVRNVRLICL